MLTWFNLRDLTGILFIIMPLVCLLFFSLYNSLIMNVLTSLKHYGAEIVLYLSGLYLLGL